MIFTRPLLQRDLLEALSGRRISITKIKFFQNDAGNGGTFADVAVATLFRTGDGYKGGRKVAVKKLRLIINSDMTEEKFLRVSPLAYLDFQRDSPAPSRCSSTSSVCWTSCLTLMLLGSSDLWRTSKIASPGWFSPGKRMGIFANSFVLGTGRSQKGYL